MSLVVVVEGPNGAGKSSLISKIIKKFIFAKWEVVYKRTTWKNFKERYQDVFTIDLNEPNKVYIYDRLHWGGQVYGPIKRGIPDLPKDQYKNFEIQLRKYFGDRLVMIYCKLPLKDLIANQKLNKEEYIKENEIEQELLLFDLTAKESIIENKHTFSYLVQDKELFIERIFNDYLKKEN